MLQSRKKLPSKWNQGLKPAVCWCFNFDPYPSLLETSAAALSSPARNVPSPLQSTRPVSCEVKEASMARPVKGRRVSTQPQGASKHQEGEPKESQPPTLYPHSNIHVGHAIFISFLCIGCIWKSYFVWDSEQKPLESLKVERLPSGWLGPVDCYSAECLLFVHVRSFNTTGAKKEHSINIKSNPAKWIAIARGSPGPRLAAAPWKQFNQLSHQHIYRSGASTFTWP